MSVILSYYTTVAVFKERIVTIVREIDSIPDSFTIVTYFWCKIATIVKYLQLSQYQSEKLWHLWMLDFLNAAELICNGLNWTMLISGGSCVRNSETNIFIGMRHWYLFELLSPVLVWRKTRIILAVAIIGDKILHCFPICTYLTLNMIYIIRLGSLHDWVVPLEVARP